MTVAPYVGAWIETTLLLKVKYLLKSHPTWVRGLKHFGSRPICSKKESHPTWVRGLKLYATTQEADQRESHPTWVRGLKQFGSMQRTS